MAALFWVGGSVAYDGVTNTLATTTGGTATVASIAAADTVTFDANSPAAAAVTTSAAINCTSIVLNTGFTGSLTMSNALTTSGVVTHTQGTLNTNGQTCSWGSYNGSGSLVRTLTLGTSPVAITTASATIWGLGVTTNYTMTANTATITCAAASQSFSVQSGFNFNGASINATGAGTFQLNNSCTLANLTRTGTAIKTDSLNLGATSYTITGNLTLTGNSLTNRLLVSNIATPGSQRSVAVSGTITLTNVDFSDIALSGAATPASGTSVGDGGNNAGITFTTPVTRFWVGNTGSFSSTAQWSTSTGGATGATVPLIHDTILVDANSVTLATQTITCDMPRTGSINFTGVLNTPAFTNSVALLSLYGSLTLSAGMTWTSGTGPYQYAGRGSNTIDTKGLTQSNSTIINSGTGTYTLAGNFKMTATLALTHTSGTFDASTFNVDIGAVSTSGSVTRTLSLGTGTWTLRATGTIWNATTITGLTQNASSSTIVIADTSVTAKTFIGGAAQTYNNITVTAAGTGAVIFNGSWIANTLTLNGPKTIQMTASTTKTLSSLVLTGSAGNVITLNSVTAGTKATLTLLAPSTSAFTAFQDIYASANEIDATNNGTDNGNNLGVIFTRTENRYQGLLGAGA